MKRLSVRAVLGRPCGGFLGLAFVAATASADEITFDERVLTTDMNEAISVHIADLDGDGDPDILTGAVLDDTVGWFANDGLGTFSAQPDVSNGANGVRSVFAADLDDDGDLDVLSVSQVDMIVAWYANDGNGAFTLQPAIDSSVNGGWCVTAADLDGDDVPDVLVASEGDDTVAWWRNDGTGNFSDKNVITDTADIARSVFAADLDEDGDLDVLSASEGDATIAWFENTDGDGNFVEHFITTTLTNALEVSAADLNGDGHVDVIAGSREPGASQIVWFANDGDANFAPAQLVTDAVDHVWSVVAVDMDDDGDADIVSASSEDDTVAWYENVDGLGTFGPIQVISSTSTRARSVDAADLDGDGDVDVAAAAWLDDTIAWFEHELVVPELADIGGALGGTSGDPVLTGASCLAGGTSISLSLDNALENALAYLAVGFSAANLPFKGGTLVPQPDLLITVNTGPFGQITLSTTLPPSLPPGVPIFFQYWIVDPAGPNGFAASNALTGTTM